MQLAPPFQNSGSAPESLAIFLANMSNVICRDESTSLSARYARAQSNDALDLKFGYDRYVTPVDRMGWLINMHPVS